MRPERPICSRIWKEWTEWTIWMLPRMSPGLLFRPRRVGAQLTVLADRGREGWSALILASSPERASPAPTRARPRSPVQSPIRGWSGPMAEVGQYRHHATVLVTGVAQVQLQED